MKHKMTFKEILPLIALLSVAVAGATSTTMSNVLTVVAAEFPEMSTTSIYQLVTIPSLISMIVSIPLGTIVGRKIGYKQVLLTGLFCHLIGGIGPIFIQGSYIAVLICRIIFGIGLGHTGFVVAVIMSSYTGELRTKMLSINSLCANALFMIFASLSGVLGAISYTASFCVYFASVISIILMIVFFKEPEFSKNTIAALKNKDHADTDNKAKLKLRVHPIAMFFIGMNFIVLLVKYPVLMQVSFYIQSKGFSALVGTTIVAGTLSSVYKLGSMLGAAVFPIFNKKCSRIVYPSFLLLCAVQFAMCLASKTMITVYIAYFIGGLGYASQAIASNVYISSVNDKASMGLATSLNIAFMYAAIYVSTYYVGLVNALVKQTTQINIEYGNWYFAVVFFVILAAIFFIKDPRPKVYTQELQAEKIQLDER